MHMYDVGVNDPSNPLCEGGALDIHRAIWKIAKEKGFTLPGHHYKGPGNVLNKQLKYDPKTGEMWEIYGKTTAKTDRISGTTSITPVAAGRRRAVASLPIRDT